MDVGWEGWRQPTRTWPLLPLPDETWRRCLSGGGCSCWSARCRATATREARRQMCGSCSRNWHQDCPVTLLLFHSSLKNNRVYRIPPFRSHIIRQLWMALPLPQIKGHLPVEWFATLWGYAPHLTSGTRSLFICNTEWRQEPNHQVENKQASRKQMTSLSYWVNKWDDCTF